MPKDKVVHNSEVEQYVHADKTRLNNPEIGLVNPDKEQSGNKKDYKFDPHLDPELQWAGKAERTSFEVPTVSLHAHERIDSKTIIESVKKEVENEQPSLFATEKKPLRQAVEFYKHENRWSNRLVAGDSLLVMNSLLEKEGMGSKVQTIYFDPPYGIKYGSNFQPFVNKRDVKDGKDEDLTVEPEMIKAFRDTWEIGIHSYLSYLRDRLTLAKDLLTDSGSIFVQISDENVHRVRLIMDEVFGSENFVSLIGYKRSSGFETRFISNLYDYLIWYGKDKSKLKFNQLYFEKKVGEDTYYDKLMLEDGTIVPYLDFQEEIPKSSKFLFYQPIISSGASLNLSYEYLHKNKTYYSGDNRHWKTTKEGLSKIAKSMRLYSSENTLKFIRFQDDYPVSPLTNNWDDTVNLIEKSYVVQTNVKAIQRCILMTSDPGDLVFDPTCLRAGSLVYVGGFFSPLNILVHNSLAVDSPRLREELFSGASQNNYSTEDTPRLREELFSGASQNNYSTEDSPRLRGELYSEVLQEQKDRRGESNKQVLHDEPVPLTHKSWLPVEDLLPGMQVLSHDGKLHKIIRTIQRNYHGLMVGVNHDKAESTLWITGDHRVLIKRKNANFGGKNSWKHVPYHHFQYAKNLRKRNTRAEKFIWKYLKETFPDIKFRRQHTIGNYIVDFYSRELHLVLELDGAHHYTEDGMAYDKIRDSYLESCGVKVLRIENSIALENPDSIGNIIYELKNNIVDEERQWVRADELKEGDTIFFGESQEPVCITSLEYDETSETVYDIEVEDAHSFLTESCMVHNCGSGTTAYVAEQWGRRWITCDTSRVAISLAKQRLMTASFDYYELKDDKKGVSGNFKYKTVPHITLKSIANNGEIDIIHEKWEKSLKPLHEKINTLTKSKFEEWEIPREPDSKWSAEAKKALSEYWEKKKQRQKDIDDSISRHADQETLVDQPLPDKKRTRVTGPFTVEAVPSPTVKALGEVNDEKPSMDSVDTSIVRSGATLKQSEWRSELARVGVRAKKGNKIEFAYLEVLAGTKYLHAVGETKEKNPKRVIVSFGPEFAPYDKTLVELAIREAEKLRPKAEIILFCAFQFEEEAAKDIEETNWEGVTLLKVQMNTDLFVDDLKKKRSQNDSFWLIGQPDVVLREIKKGDHKGKYEIEVLGFDYYDPKTNEVKSGGKGEIAMWMLDSDYDGRSIFPKQVFFPLAGDKDGWAKLGRDLKADLDEELLEAFRTTVSLPFNPGKQIAVKIVDNRGIESIRVFKA
jgi:very-short-patch-repair endonuclease/DNA modification methylase